MDRFVHDLRFALRQIRRRPLLSIVAALSLAVGVGANTAIFSAVNALLLRPPPGVAEPERVVELGRTRPDGSGFDSFAYPDFEDLRAEVAALDRIAAFSPSVFSLSRGGEGERVTGMLVSPAYFDVMGVAPWRGRLFRPDEDAPAAGASSVVLAHGFWEGRLGADPSIVGSTIRINRVPLEVVGITPPEFQGHMAGFRPDVFLPIRATSALGGTPASTFENRGASWHQAVGRLAPGATLAEAELQARGVYARLAEAWPATNRGRSVRLVPIGLVPGAARAPVGAFLGVLMAMVVLILLVTCANVAGMFVARATAREREIAVRLSLGAGRGRLVQQLLTEAVVVFALGGALGAAVGARALELLPIDRLPVPIPVSVDLSPDLTVVAFALAITLGTGLVFGLLPALQSTRRDLNTALRGGDARPEGAGLMRRFFVSGQIALSLILLVSAGLLVRALDRAGAIETGFDPSGAYLTGVDLEMEGFDAEAGPGVQDAILERVGALPGVESAALALDLPLDLGSHGTSAQPEGWSDADGRESLGVDFNHVTPGYFSTLRVPLLQGRAFTATDRPGSEPVVVVSRAFVARAWPGEDALGRRLRISLGGLSEEWRTIVGVAEDVRNQFLGEEPGPMVYLPLAQAYQPGTKVLVRADGDLTTVAPALRAAILEAAPSISLEPVESVERYTSIGILPQRLAAAVTSGLGVLAVLIAGLGLYGVIAFSVSRRSREIGVRMALGADRGRVMRHVLLGGLRLALPGLAVGALGALGAGRVLRFLLLGLDPADPVTLAGVAATLLGVALLASWVPGRRAASLHPVEALRTE